MGCRRCRARRWARLLSTRDLIARRSCALVTQTEHPAARTCVHRERVHTNVYFARVCNQTSHYSTLRQTIIGRVIIARPRSDRAPREPANASPWRLCFTTARSKEPLSFCFQAGKFSYERKQDASLFVINGLAETSPAFPRRGVASCSRLDLPRVREIWHLRESIPLNLSKLRLLIATRLSLRLKLTLCQPTTS